MTIDVSASRGAYLPPAWVRVALFPARTRRGAIAWVSFNSLVSLATLLWVWLSFEPRVVPIGVVASLIGAMTSIAIPHGDRFGTWAWFATGQRRL